MEGRLSHMALLCVENDGIQNVRDRTVSQAVSRETGLLGDSSRDVRYNDEVEVLCLLWR